MGIKSNGVSYAKIQVKTFSAEIRAKLDSEINKWLYENPNLEECELIDLKFSVNPGTFPNVTYSALLIYGYTK